MLRASTYVRLRPLRNWIIQIDFLCMIRANNLSTASHSAQTFQPTIPAFNALAHNNIRRTLRPVPLNKRRVNDKIKLLLVMMFILVLFGGGLGFYMATKNSDASGNKAGNVIPYPSYLPGKGVFALNDPMKDDSKGYSWSPPNFRFCNIYQASLHVHVFGDQSDLAHFHPCIGKTPIFRRFRVPGEHDYRNG
jgi:hypothetical protein